MSTPTDSDATAIRVEAMSADLPERPMASRHYFCPDCGQCCECTGAARLLPHERCGLAS